MKSPFLISAIFIVFSFVYASDNISIAGEKLKAKNSDSNIQAIDSEVLPIDIEKIIKLVLRNQSWTRSMLKRF